MSVERWYNDKKTIYAALYAIHNMFLIHLWLDKFW